MKINLLLAVATVFALGPVALADHHEGDHKDHGDGHDHHAIAGPNGGKVLHDVDPHAELFVTKERKIQLTFLDDKGKAVAPAEQSISVICGKRSAPTKMTFEKKGNAFVSDKPLPDGINIPAVLQIKMTPDGKKKTIRLNLNLEDCPTCDHLEYACTCDHGHDEKKD